jgi:predicted ATPase
VLKSLRIENFKSWEDTGNVRVAPITGIFGENSSGKSSLTQFLLLLKQTKETTDRGLPLDFGDREKFANLGSYKDSVFRHDEKRRIKWHLNWELPDTLTVTNPLDSRKSVLFSGEQISFESQVGIRNKRLETDYIKYVFSDHEFSFSRKSEGSSAYKLDASSQVKSNFRFIRTAGRAWDLPGPIKSYAFPDQAKTYFQNTDFLSDLELEYEDFFDHIFYLGPLRDHPRREYMWSGASPLDVGQRGERAIDAILAARFGNEKRNRGTKKRLYLFEEFIAQWLQDLGLIHSFSVREIGQDSNLYKVLVRKSPNSPEALITDVGFGVSQLLPVLVLLYFVPEGSVILLEQPEIHLHPSVQANLADLIINAAETRNVQIIIESHSEHLLRRLQRRIAEGQRTPESMAMYFCHQEKGYSHLMPLEIDLYGNIRNWPEGFFGDDFGEIAAMQEAALKRKITEQK